jgi:DNA-binding NarL/FixJ family response regulator
MRLGILAEWPIVRLGLHSVLESQPDFKVAWLAGSAREAYLLAVEEPTDATVVDAELDGAPAIIRQLVSQQAATRVVVLGAVPDDAVWTEMAKAGALGFIDKALPSQHIVARLRCILGGSPRTHRDAGRAAAGAPRPRRAFDHDRHPRRPPPDSWRSVLSQREVEVLVAVRSGWTSDEIARRLGISSSTVNKHVNGILRKLGARSRAQAAALLERPESYASLIATMHGITTAAMKISDPEAAADFIAGRVGEVLAVDHILVALGHHRACRPPGRGLDHSSIEEEAVRLAAAGHRVLISSRCETVFAVPIAAASGTLGWLVLGLAGAGTIKRDQADAVIYLAADLARSLEGAPLIETRC